MPQKEYDEFHWHYIQAPEEMFVLSKFDFDDDAKVAEARKA